MAVIQKNFLQSGIFQIGGYENDRFQFKLGGKFTWTCPYGQKTAILKFDKCHFSISSRNANSVQMVVSIKKFHFWGISFQLFYQGRSSEFSYKSVGGLSPSQFKSLHLANHLRPSLISIETNLSAILYSMYFIKSRVSDRRSKNE